MALSPSSTALPPTAWPSPYTPTPPLANLPSVGYPVQGQTTFASATPPPETTQPSTTTTFNPWALPLTAASGLAVGSLLPNPLGLLKPKEGAFAKDLAALNIEFKPNATQLVTIATPSGGDTVLVSPLGHSKPTRLEVIHNPETATPQVTLARLLKASKEANLPASTVIQGIPVFAHPKSTFKPDELAATLQNQLEAGKQPEWRLSERTMSDAEVDGVIKAQKLVFISPEAEAIFKAALGNESDPLVKAGAKVAERLSKLLTYHATKGEHLFDVVNKALVNAIPEGLVGHALIELAKIAPAGSTIRSAEEGKQEILQEALSLVTQTSLQHGELLSHFMRLTGIR